MVQVSRENKNWYETLKTNDSRWRKRKKNKNEGRKKRERKMTDKKGGASTNKGGGVGGFPWGNGLRNDPLSPRKNSVNGYLPGCVGG